MQTQELWNTRAGFILAAAGSAVGLGNIWRFPYVTGENGGGAFVLVYLLLNTLTRHYYLWRLRALAIGLIMVCLLVTMMTV